MHNSPPKKGGQYLAAIIAMTEGAVRAPQSYFKGGTQPYRLKPGWSLVMTQMDFVGVPATASQPPPPPT